MVQPAQDSGQTTVRVDTRQDGTYRLRIMIPREERKATITALKEAGVERPLDELQEGGVTATAGVIASVTGALRLKSVLIALIKINEGKKIKFTSGTIDLELEGYSAEAAKDIARVFKELELGAAPESESDDTTTPT